MKGRGPAVKSQPPFVIPSSWHELADTPDRLATLQDQVASVAANMVQLVQLWRQSICSWYTVVGPLGS
jgi:hypothetical protein